MGLTRQLWADERRAYRGLIYKRAAYRSMIREHNNNDPRLSPRDVTMLQDGIVKMTHEARAMLFQARARALGYRDNDPDRVRRVREMCSTPVVRWHASGTSTDSDDLTQREHI
jgi:hypothetical protein